MLIEKIESAKLSWLHGNMGYMDSWLHGALGGWVVWINMWVELVTWVKIFFYVGQHFKWVIIFMWVAWVNIFCVGQFPV